MDEAGPLAGAIVWRTIRTDTIATLDGRQRFRGPGSNGRYVSGLSSLLYQPPFERIFFTRKSATGQTLLSRSEQNKDGKEDAGNDHR